VSARLVASRHILSMHVMTLPTFLHGAGLLVLKAAVEVATRLRPHCKLAMKGLIRTQHPQLRLHLFKRLVLKDVAQPGLDQSGTRYLLQLQPDPIHV
jgi:hypothetical protein